MSNESFRPKLSLDLSEAGGSTPLDLDLSEPTVVDESFDKLTAGLENNKTEVPVDVVAAERSRQEALKIQKEEERNAILALRTKLGDENFKDPEDTMPLAA